MTQDDIAGNGSDRLIDAVIPHGTPGRIAAALDEHFAAGADHACVQPLGHGEPPIEAYRALADHGLVHAITVALPDREQARADMTFNASDSWLIGKTRTVALAFASAVMLAFAAPTSGVPAGGPR